LREVRKRGKNRRKGVSLFRPSDLEKKEEGEVEFFVFGYYMKKRRGEGRRERVFLRRRIGKTLLYPHRK